MAVSISKRAILNVNFAGTQYYDLVDIGKFLYNFPAASDFSGPYVISWTGSANGVFIFNWGGVGFTIDSALSTPFTKTFPDRFTATTANPRIVFSFDSGQPLWPSRDIRFPAGSTNRLLVRLEDEADYLLGRYFRPDHLGLIANYNPSAVRMMDWLGGSDSYLMRWEDRSLLTDSNWQNFVTSGGIATYGTTSAANIMTLAGLPALSHGLPVQCTIGSGIVRGTQNTVTGVTRANPGVVTYSGTDNYQNGDKIIFRVTTGMTQLDYRIGTVANVDTAANTFELSGLDTSAFTAWSSGSVMQYVSLNGYPVFFNSGTEPAAIFGSGYIATNDIKTFYFDKNLRAKDEAGADIIGAWRFNNNGNDRFHRAGAPPALIVAYISELDAVAQSLGKGSTDLYACVPFSSILSMDDDYSTSSSVAIQLVNLFLNGGDGVAAAPSRCRIFLALGNETWNPGAGFSAAIYFGRLGQIRYGAGQGGGGGDYASYHTLRHAVMVSDVRAAFPDDLDRIVFVMEGQGTLGVSGLNVGRMDGNSNVAGDALYQSIGGGAVGTNNAFWDCFAIASYFELSPTFITGTLPSLVTQWVSGSASQKDAAIASVVNGAVSSSGNNESIERYRDTLLPAYDTKMASLDRMLIGYEGDNQFTINTTVNDTYNFLWAARSDQRWATAYRSWFDAWKQYDNVGMPGKFIMVQSASVDHRWDNVSYGYNDTYANGVEGGSLDLAWDEITDYNNPRATRAAPDPFTAADIANLRHHQEELKKAEQRRSKNKREVQAKLRDAVEEVYDKLSGIAPAAAAKVAAVIPAKAKVTETAAGPDTETPAIDWSKVTAAQIAKVIATMDAYAAQIESERRQQAIARADAARHQDEDDIETLLMAVR